MLSCGLCTCRNTEQPSSGVCPTRRIHRHVIRVALAHILTYPALCRLLHPPCMGMPWTLQQRSSSRALQEEQGRIYRRCQPCPSICRRSLRACWVGAICRLREMRSSCTAHSCSSRWACCKTQEDRCAILQHRLRLQLLIHDRCCAPDLPHWLRHICMHCTQACSDEVQPSAPY